MRLSRRTFLGTTVPFALGGCSGFSAAGYAVPRRPPASERVSLGIIGCGTQAYGNVGQFLQDPRVQISVTCDPVLEAPQNAPLLRELRKNKYEIKDYSKIS